MVPSGTGVNELDLEVERLMSMMEPSYLEGKTDTAEALRRLMFAAAIAVADISEGISDEQKEKFEEFFGKHSFSDKLDVEKLKSELPERIAQANQLASVPQRMQVLRDLCLISRADGDTTEAERDLLCQIGKDLEIPSLFVTKSLDEDSELD